MPENSLDEVFDKYVEMNVAHPFMEGNGRSTRIWLDLMLKTRHQCCIDWSKIGKYDYLEAMRQSVADASRIKQLLHQAVTNDTGSRELFMKGIDYSYYYEQEDWKMYEPKIRFKGFQGEWVEKALIEYVCVTCNHEA